MAQAYVNNNFHVLVVGAGKPRLRPDYSNEAQV